jgi:ribonuclease HI
MRPLVHVYTDASLRQDAGVAGFAVVFEHLSLALTVPERLRQRYRLETETGRNGAAAWTGLLRASDIQGAELFAVAAALELLDEAATPPAVLVLCDNQYVVDWLRSTVSQEEHWPRYGRLIRHVRSLAPGLVWEVAKVRGHSGVPGNETADRLARRRLRRYCSSPSRVKSSR